MAPFLLMRGDSRYGKINSLLPKRKHLVYDSTNRLYRKIVLFQRMKVRERGEDTMPCLRMSVNRLREGMMIKEDVFSKTGAVIVPDGAVVTKDVVALLTRHFVDSVMVEYPTGTAGTECAGEGTASERVPGRVLGCRTVDFGRTERYCIPE